jgi:hypothetical protein
MCDNLFSLALGTEQDLAMKFSFASSLGSTTTSYSCEEDNAVEVMIHFIHFMQSAGFSLSVISDATESALQEFNCITH